VLHIGVFGPLPGGMAQVLNEYLSWRFAGLRVRATASTRGRGDRWALLRSARCVLVLLAARLSRRPHAVVLHLSSGGSFVREGGLAALARVLGLPVAVHLHGSDFAEFADRWPRLVAAVLRRPDRVYVLTAETRDIARAAVGPARADRVVTVTNGVAAPDTVPAKEPLVVFAGLVGVRKGADVLLAAWPSVHARHPDWRLVVAGPVTADLAAHPASPSVTMLGAVGRDEVARWQSRAAIAVLPSRQEALPMFLLESMAQGCAVVATPVGEVEDLVAGCGVVVPVGDADRLAAALDELARDPVRVARLGAAAHARIVQRYSEQAVSALFEHEWTDLLASRRRAT
jgi:glycosyltransferase involved in cell wall biosynthesis